jgi:hypothetical protein
MGIGPEPAQMLRGLGLPKGFTVCELGDQFFHSGDRRAPGFWKSPAEELYRELGCSRYEAIDGNGRGTITADLNAPLDPHPGKFTLVTDFGTSEHVFDFAQCWRTIHSLCKPRGLIIFEKPVQGYPDHGFYNIHKTFFMDVAVANAYTIDGLCYIKTNRGHHWRGIFRKTAETPETLVNPQQGKYQRTLKI